MSILEAFLIAVSLCADCFAVSLCSGTGLAGSGTKGGTKPGAAIARIAIAFAIIQTALMFTGWALGAAVYSFVSRYAGWIGFALLLFVGGSLLIAGIRGDEEHLKLDGLRNIILAGIATSIDAMAIGAANSMEGISLKGMLVPLAFVFVITALSVVAGISGGKALGQRFGNAARIFGGIVLIAIGLNMILHIL
ncbi:MAG: manganese efflux pump [Bacteroidales bacterium]|nr:manganese efflux pump [Bacteroidales bacterium]